MQAPNSDDSARVVGEGGASGRRVGQQSAQASTNACALDVDEEASGVEGGCGTPERLSAAHTDTRPCHQPPDATSILVCAIPPYLGAFPRSHLLDRRHTTRSGEVMICKVNEMRPRSSDPAETVLCRAPCRTFLKPASRRSPGVRRTRSPSSPILPRRGCLRGGNAAKLVCSRGWFSYLPCTFASK